MMKINTKELNLTNRLIRLHDEVTVKAVKDGIATPKKYIQGYCHYLHLLYLGRECIRKQQHIKRRIMHRYQQQYRLTKNRLSR